MRRRRPPRPGHLQTLSPLRIATQILTLQLLHYLVATLLILFTALAAGKRFTLGLILDWRTLRGDTAVGWTLGLCWVLDAGAGVIFLLLFIARSKLVLDFALTVHFLHLVVTSLYTGRVPTNWLWWGLQGVSAGVMIAGGVWACRWRELRPIEFGGGGAGKTGRRGNGDGGAGGEYELVGRGGGGDGGDV
ncbi:MAG: hypothetical protein LQ338_005840 [Usnochroma carphineum]|nr:MAG: hypothetical protein LQ338_005840 [Usnochroma carphineum]